MNPIASIVLTVLTICTVGANAGLDTSSFGSAEVTTAAGTATTYYYKSCTASSDGYSMYCAPFAAAAVLKVEFTTETVSSFGDTEVTAAAGTATAYYYTTRVPSESQNWI